MFEGESPKKKCYRSKTWKESDGSQNKKTRVENASFTSGGS